MVADTPHGHRWGDRCPASPQSILLLAVVKVNKIRVGGGF